MDTVETAGRHEQMRHEPPSYKYFRAVDHTSLKSATDLRGEQIITIQTIADLGLLCEGWMLQMCMLRAKAEVSELSEEDMKTAKNLQTMIGSYRTILESIGQQNVLIVAEDTARERAELKLAQKPN